MEQTREKHLLEPKKGRQKMSEKQILLSVITYELSKRLGKKAAQAEFHRMALDTILDSPTGGEKILPAAMVVRRLRRLAEVALLHDAGGTSIGHARSRAFSVAERGARNGKIDLWISCDDDTQADQETLRHLVQSIDPDQPQIVIVPCWLRQETPVVNITLDPDAVLDRVSSSGARLRRALYGGFGIVAVSRAALLELGQLYRDLTFIDDDSVERIGIFCEFLKEGWWYREDYAFFSRVPEHIRIEALLTGMTDHDGKILRLEAADKHPMIPRPEAFSRRDTQPPPPACTCAARTASPGEPVFHAPWCAAAAAAAEPQQPETVRCGVCSTPYELLVRQACACVVAPVEALCQSCGTVPCTCVRCGQEGGVVEPDGRHRYGGVCDYRRGHEGRHSWEPHDYEDAPAAALVV